MAATGLGTPVSQRARVRPALGSAARHLALLAVALAFLYPLCWVLVSSLKPGDEIATAPLSFDPGSLSLDNYSSLLSAVPMWVGFKNTAIVVIGKGLMTMFFCPLGGFAFAKYRFRGRRFLFTFVLATMMLPPIVLLIPLLLEMGTLGWVDSYQALILPGSIGAFGIFWMRQQIADVPDELLDAGRIDGCSPFGVFRRIVLPVLRPALAALAILTFIDIYNDFVWPVVVINSDDMQTLQVMLSAVTTQINNAQVGTTGQSAWGEVLAACTLASLPLIVVFLALQRHFIQGVLAGSVKG